ncbi:hypothetical protein [Brachybacterium hainanense]|uniref:Ribbon-helix-helix protein CopG domain-containing protein n=1 Tax=Brachybacterium hainanense TaxID=1541174 RepID=A0ABV6RC37_9MICO
MSAASKSKPVGVRFSPSELAELDRQRALLGGVPRGTAIKQMWQRFGDDAAEVAAQHADVAASNAKAIQPLVDALEAAVAAWNARAHQRQMIGANKNQVAKFASTLLLVLREGGDVDEERLDALVLADQGIARSLEQQLAAEREDDLVLSGVRAALERMRAEP